MKKKTMTLVSSVAAIAVCSSVMVGSTYALFTSEDKVNVAVTAGNVAVEATVGELTATTTLDGEYKATSDTEVNFQNGGFAQIAGGGIILDRVTPGDTLTFPVTVTNSSNVKTKVRLTYAVDNGYLLASALTVQVDDSELTGKARYSTGWTVVEEAKTDIYNFTVALPNHEDSTIDNLYKGLSTKISFVVEAVQSNANTDGNTVDEALPDYSELKEKFLAGTNVSEVGTIDGFKEAVKEGGIIVLDNDVEISEQTDGDFRDAKPAEVDFQGKSIAGANNNIAVRAIRSEVTLKNGTINAEQGTFCTVSASNGTANLENMTLYNCTQNGNSIKCFGGGVINVRDTVVNSTMGGGCEAAGGTINIYEGCVFTQAGAYDHNSTNTAASGGGVLNIHGGTFQSANYGVYIFNSGATANIYGGQFSATTVLKADKSTSAAQSIINVYGGTFDGALSIANGATLIISGGTFSNIGITEEQFAAFVAEGHTYTVTDGVYVVS